MSMYKDWSRFHSFSEVYEYHGHFAGPDDEKQRQTMEFEGEIGIPNSDGGFRLRSALEGEKGGGLSFSRKPLIEKLEKIPCPLRFGEIGCYFIRVKINGEKWDYIGKSAEEEKGIADRLRDHLIKIAGTTSINYLGSTKKFTALYQRIREDYKLKINSDFFKEHVSMAFVKVDPNSKTKIETVSKIEGMALALYKKINGDFPFLNDTDETKGLVGFEQLLT